jgi:hypothetical protein
MGKFRIKDYFEDEEVGYTGSKVPKKKKDLWAKPRKQNKIKKFKD